MSTMPAEEQIRDGAPRLIAIAIWTSLNSIGLMLCLRKLAGALINPLSTGQYSLCLFAIAGAGGVALYLATPIETIRRGSFRTLPPIQLLAVALSLAPIFWFGCVFLASETFAGWIFATLCGGATLGCLLYNCGLLPLHVDSPSVNAESTLPLRQDGPTIPSRLAEIHVAATDPADPDEEAESPEPDVAEEEVSCWTKRRLNAAGADQLEGVTAAEFAPRQKQAIVHLAFCPPFVRTPELACVPVAESGARLKVGAIYPYGARIEVRRTENTSEPTTVHIHFTAIGPSAKESLRRAS